MSDTCSSEVPQQKLARRRAAARSRPRKSASLRHRVRRARLCGTELAASLRHRVAAQGCESAARSWPREAASLRQGVHCKSWRACALSCNAAFVCVFVLAHRCVVTRAWRRGVGRGSHNLGFRSSRVVTCGGGCAGACKRCACGHTCAWCGCSACQSVVTRSNARAVVSATRRRQRSVVCARRGRCGAGSCFPTLLPFILSRRRSFLSVLLLCFLPLPHAVPKNRGGGRQSPWELGSEAWGRGRNVVVLGLAKAALTYSVRL